MIQKLQQFVLPESRMPTYTIGLLQTKAYRTLKRETTELLSEYSLSTLDWALLGHLSETEDGMNSSEIADLLGVALPFVTVMVRELQKKKLITKRKSKTDKRENRIVLTDAATQLIPKIEKKLRAAFKTKLGASAVPHLRGYFHILRLLAQ